MPTDNVPGTGSPPRFATDGFDAVPPREVIEELLKRRRPPPPIVIPSAPPRAPHGWLKGLIGYAMLVALPVVGLIILATFSSSWHPSFEARASSLVATPPPPRVLSTPAPLVPSPTRTPPVVEVRRAEPVPVTVKRGELVEPTVLRATLVSVPVGTSGAIIMPCDGQAVTVVYRGEIPSFGDLPRDPQLGDMYKVTEGRQQEWVFYQLANFANPVRVDPGFRRFQLGTWSMSSWRTKAEDKRSRSSDNSYIESPAKLEKQFEAALERNRLKLAEQREEIRRKAAIQRGVNTGKK